MRPSHDNTAALSFEEMKDQRYQHLVAPAPRDLLGRPVTRTAFAPPPHDPLTAAAAGNGEDHQHRPPPSAAQPALAPHNRNAPVTAVKQPRAFDHALHARAAREAEADELCDEHVVLAAEGAATRRRTLAAAAAADHNSHTALPAQAVADHPVHSEAALALAP